MMEPFTQFAALGVPLDEANLDTNQICPTRFNKRLRGPGYEIVLFHDRRFRPDGTENPDFILNREPYRKARILVADRNFGCGSSRESAVWALAACGFRSVIAPSFGDIFFNNCFKNGMLPIILPDGVVADLCQQLYANPRSEISIDLESQIVKSPDGTSHPFEVPPFRRICLLNGLDDIGLTLQHTEAIDAFRERYKAEMSWLF